MNDYFDGTSRFSDLPDLIPPSLFADIMGCSIQNVRELIHSGELPGIRIGKRLYIVRSEFLKQLDAGVYSL